MSGRFGTNFTETEALLAVSVDDIGAAEEILSEMYPGELEKLARNARELAEMCRAMESIKRRESGR